MDKKQEARLPGMVASWLLVNMQSESARNNIQTLLRLFTEEQKEELRVIIKNDLTTRLENQMMALQEQIDLMNIGG